MLKNRIKVKYLYYIGMGAALCLFLASLFFIGVYLGMKSQTPPDLPAVATADVTTAGITTPGASTDPVPDDTSVPASETQQGQSEPSSDPATDTPAPDTLPPDTEPLTSSGPNTSEPVTTAPEPAVYPVTDRRVVVCVDPGHGYADPGAIGGFLDGVYEKDINLAVALLVSDYLRDLDFDVIMTRADDEIPADYRSDEPYLFNPYDREAFVRAQKTVDLFVSIHCNSMPEGNGNEVYAGTEIYYYLKNSELTPSYAGAVADAVGRSAGRNCRIIGLDYDNAYYVTKEMPVPSVLIEMAYVTNAEDCKLLLGERFRIQMARGIAQGIADFANQHMR